MLKKILNFFEDNHRFAMLVIIIILVVLFVTSYGWYNFVLFLGDMLLMMFGAGVFFALELIALIILGTAWYGDNIELDKIFEEGTVLYMTYANLFVLLTYYFLTPGMKSFLGG